MRFERLNRAAEARADETLLDVARRAGAPLGNSCGGIGICGRCAVKVVSGAESLTPKTALEGRAKLDADERLACMAVVLGDCAITTGYW